MLAACVLPKLYRGSHFLQTSNICPWWTKCSKQKIGCKMQWHANYMWSNKKAGMMAIGPSHPLQ